MDNLPAGGSGGGGGVYPDSVESSPRSRGGGSEQWDDLFPSSAAPAKLRFMCSYGGQIVPRPHDRALCYLGGDTRIVAVDRHATLADLSAKLSRSLLGGRPFSLKYQLPSEDLDSLISVTTDEDLDNMIEEYDRVSASGSGSGSSHGGGAGKVSRLRLFLFPAMSAESNSSSMGSLLDDSKSEIWFVDALNGAIGMGGVIPRAPNSAASSVNCLLGLENDHLSSVAAAANNAGAPLNPNSEQSSLPRPDSSGKMTAMPESQMMDKSSSFGSASSAATPSHLPPIRVRPADLEPDQRLACGDMEDRFSQLSVSMQKQEEGFKDGGFVAQDNYYHQHPPGDPSPLCAAAASTTTTNISSTDNPSLSGSLLSTEDENSFHGGAGGALPQPLHHHQQQQQQKLDSFELPTSDRAVYYQEKTSPVTADMNPVSDAKQNGNHQVFDPNLRVQMQVAEQGYMLAMQSEQLQQQNQHQHQHQQLQQQQQQLQQQQQQQQQLQQQQQQLQQQQYVHVNPQLMQHHPSSPMVPIQSYYQMHQPLQAQPQLRQTGPYNQQIPVYYMQPRAPAGYSITMQQPNPIPVPSSTSMTVPFHNAVLPTQGPTSPPMAELGAAAANIYRTSTPAAAAANIYRTSTPAAAAAQPPPIPQQINLTGQSHPYVGYQTMHLHPSQSPAAAASYGYDFPNSVCTQPMYYTQGTSSSAPVPSHYQTVTSSAATVISDLHPQLQ